MKTIAAAVFVLCLCAGALAQKDNSVLKSDKKQDRSISNKKWPVKFAGAKVELVITDQSALIKQGEVTVLEILAVSISEVGYDNSSHYPGWELLKDAGVLTGSGGEEVIFAPILLAPAAILLPFKSTKHFVRILWEDKGNPSEVLLEVGKQDYHVLLDELQRLWGKSWIGLPQARKKLVSEIELRILMIVDTNSDEA